MILKRGYVALKEKLPFFKEHTSFLCLYCYISLQINFVLHQVSEVHEMKSSFINCTFLQKIFSKKNEMVEG